MVFTDKRRAFLCACVWGGWGWGGKGRSAGGAVWKDPRQTNKFKRSHNTKKKQLANTKQKQQANISPLIICIGVGQWCHKLVYYVGQ